MEILFFLAAMITLIIITCITTYCNPCKHQYKIIHKEDIISKTSYNSSSYEKTGMRYVQRCEKCGKIKSTKI